MKHNILLIPKKKLKSEYLYSLSLFLNIKLTLSIEINKLTRKIYLQLQNPVSSISFTFTYQITFHTQCRN